MHLSFKINSSDIETFIEHWASTYAENPDDADARYLQNIGRPLTPQSLQKLFEWKNGTKISARKTESILRNYPFSFEGDLQDRYLNHKMPGGAIWNIFYLHCIDKDKWPIFDQHTFRAMVYMKSGKFSELPQSNREKYSLYLREYIPFYNLLSAKKHRDADRALFEFGKFLKFAKRYA